ncbi:MAG TPA: class I SAM-dependent methyltransferase, partial [Bacteroidia bacterium]|nr:class I SAM-dependent methyltransferase [Bacteroidia bacterium]
DIPATQKYDRITSIATFEHIMDLPFVVAKAALLLNENGHLRVAIPNEGTIMWTLGTKVTGFEFKKKYGLDYQTLMKYEHVNTSDDIEKVLEYFFGKTRCSVFGISKGLAFYRFYDCSMPDLGKVKKYLAGK